MQFILNKALTLPRDGACPFIVSPKDSIHLEKHGVISFSRPENPRLYELT